MLRPEDVMLERFDSVADVCKRLREPRKPGAGHTSELGDCDWNGGVSYKDALDLIENGWPEGAGLASDILEHLSLLPALGTEYEFENASSGAYFDMGAYMAGVPECMLQPTEVIRRGVKFLNIYMSVDGCGYIEPETFMARGAACIAVIDALEKMRVRCRLSMYTATRSSFAKWVTTYTLKEYEDPLVITDIAFLLAHPAALRRTWFGLCERSEIPEAVKTSATGYGAPLEIKDPVLLREPLDTVVVPPAQANNPDGESHLMEIMMLLPDDVRALVDKREQANV